MQFTLLPALVVALAGLASAASAVEDQGRRRPRAPPVQRQPARAVGLLLRRQHEPQAGLLHRQRPAGQVRALGQRQL
ncbi:hypothetical protein PG997_014037 [Apiospora hydei]|uniref:Uncharacterized protein n=1 Tax=Apiospora hydei TaxID=1337664 RepID=A0ABR1V7W5_9PEZI